MRNGLGGLIEADDRDGLGVCRGMGDAVMLTVRSRGMLAASALGALLVAGIAGPASAEDPLPDLTWTAMSGFPFTSIDGEVTVTVETATVPAARAGSLRDLSIQRIEITNDSDHVRWFDFGIDIETQGVIEPLWLPETFNEESFGDFTPFGVTLEPGQSVSDLDEIVYRGLGIEVPGVPLYRARTAVIYELSADPILDPDAVATELVRTPTQPGEFVPVYFDGPTTPEGTVPAGRELTIVGPTNAADDVELFPGMTATATASGLPPGLPLELWLVPGFDYFFSIAMGGAVPDTAIPAGTTVTTPDGTIDATFEVPANADLDTNYRLYAGDPDEHYWPAGTYRAFTVTLPSNGGSQPAPAEADEVTVPLVGTSVTFGFPVGTGGTWSASASTTGPVVDGFTLAGDPALYYHLDTTADLGGAEVEVCISYNTGNFPGDPLRLYHYTPVAGGGYRWADITTSHTVSGAVGTVCGVTSSFSPFALGTPEPFAFEGFFDPVSKAGPNIAKPGQAVPVRFSLGGDEGLDVVTSAKFVRTGTVTNPTGEVLDAVTAGYSQLSYDASTGEYTYVWKTSKSWSQYAGRFELTLSDGTVHTFPVDFTK